MEIKPPQVPLEVIEVKVGAKPGRCYSGFGGSFATLLDSCLRKKALPGFYQEGLLVDAELKGKELCIFLSGERTDEETMAMMDITMENLSVFFTPGETPHYRLTVKCIG